MIVRMRFLISLLLAGVASAQTGGPAPGATTADWPHYGGTQLSWRYSALDQINTGNVKNLAPAWIFQTGDYAESLESTPLVIDGAMYLITPRARVFALDAATGKALWDFQTGATVTSNPISYELDGKQYVALTAGRALIAFGLE